MTDLRPSTCIVHPKNIPLEREFQEREKDLAISSPKKRQASTDEPSLSVILAASNEKQIREKLSTVDFTPDQNETIVNLVRKHPAFLGAKAESLLVRIKEEGFDHEVAWDIAFLMEKCHPARVIRSSTAVKKRSNQCQEIGRAMKRTYVNEELGCPLGKEAANRIWPEDDWSQEISSRTNDGCEKLFQALIRTIRVENCSLKIAVTGHMPSVCGRLKPDVVAWLQDWSMSPCSTGFLLCLKSTTSGLFDSDAACGAAFMYAKIILERAGPLKKCALVGVSDLKKIRWFRIELDSEQKGSSYNRLLHPYVAQQSLIIDNVRESLCKFLTLGASDVGMNLTDPTIQIFLSDSTWEFIQHLGKGATSNVYEVKKGNEVLALRVSHDSMVEEGDEQYLRQLEGIDGIPILVQKIGTTLCMKPVGKQVVDISSIDDNVEFEGLVDLLYHAHQRRIVHRDIRPENIVIAQSLEKGVMRMFLIDWGFAAPCGVATAYAGGMVTASDRVLHQCKMGGKVVYKESDDLVSLLRCTYLLCYPNQYDALDECSDRPEALLKFWKGRLQEEGNTWIEAEDSALEGDYETLKKYLRVLHYSELLARTGCWSS